MEEVVAENPQYAAVRVTKIDEKLEPELADRYDYYYVPTYFVGGVKVHEGAATKEIVEGVYRAALGEDA